MATKKRLIDANALLETLCDCCSLQQQEMCKNDPVCATALVIAEYPTVDAVEVVHGQWIEEEIYDKIICDVCGHEWNIFDNDTETFNYCPNCGAKMDGDSDD